MMASVSRAGMSSRRADAAPDKLEPAVRGARTQSYCNYHTRTHHAMFPWRNSRQIKRTVLPHSNFTLVTSVGFSTHKTAQRLRMEAVAALELFC